MSAPASDVLLSAVRTYADDFARAKKTTVGTDKKPEEIKPAVTPHTPPAIATKDTVAKRSSLPENPPFHFIQSTSGSERVLPTKKSGAKPPTPQPKQNTNAEPVAIAVPNKFAGGTIIEKKTTYTDRESLLSNEDDIFQIPSTDPNKGEGSIVTDKKRGKMGFFKALYLASADGVRSLIAAMTPPKEAAQRPVVTISKTKPETVRKAATGSALAPQQNRSVVTKPVVPKPPKANATPAPETDALPVKNTSPVPSWTYTDEKETEDTSSEPETTTQPATTTVIPPLPETRVEQPPLSSTAPKSVIKPRSVTEPTTQPAHPTPTPAPTPAPTPTPTPTPTAAPQPVAPTPIARRYRPTPEPKQSGRTWVLIAIVVIIVAGIAGVGVAVWFFASPEPEPVVTVQPIPSIVRTDSATALPLGTTQEVLLQTLTTKKEAATGLTQLYPVVNDAKGVEQPASAEQILLVLAPRAPGNFQRDIQEVTFGVSASGEPYIALTVQSFDVALSGMIGWEASMSIDLEPFMGTRVLESFDPDARTTDQIRPAFFTDAIINNRDVRLLRNSFADDALMYSFINRTTILITTNREAFAELAPLVQ